MPYKKQKLYWRHTKTIMLLVVYLRELSVFYLLIGLLAIGYVIYKLKEEVPKKKPWFNKAKIPPKLEPVDKPIRRRPQLKAVDVSVPFSSKHDLSISHQKPTTSPDKVEHKRSEYLTSKNERNFFIALRQALPDDYMVHCQTSLMALIQPVEWKNNSKTWAKRMDFVVTDETTKVVCVIELDERSHERNDRKKRDKYVNEALDGHHKLIRFKASWSYSSEEIRSKLVSEIGVL
jgi:hypothetical protein